MSLPFALPENYKIVQVAPIAAGNATAYDTISCKNAHKVWFIITHTGSSDNDPTFSLVESTDVAGSTTTAVTATFPIWLDDDAGTASDTLVRQTDAANLVVNSDNAANQLIVFEWDPAKFTAGYDCILLADSGGHASNNFAALAIIATRYPQATPPAAITD